MGQGGARRVLLSVALLVVPHLLLAWAADALAADGWRRLEAATRRQA